MSDSWIIGGVCLLITLLILSCLCLAVILGVATYLVMEDSLIGDYFGMNETTPSATPQVIRPTLQSPFEPQETSNPPGVQVQTPQGTPVTGIIAPAGTLKSLSDTDVPINNLPDLVRRLKGVEEIPQTVEPPSQPFQVGEHHTFWASNTDTNENFQVEATLRYVTDHAYFWIQDDVTFNTRDLNNLAESFENKIYPTNREFFGSEWTPGVDGDPHIFILFASGLGENISGYFSSSDEYPPLVNQYSNTHEQFNMNLDDPSIWEEYTYAVLAHEFQHMIHWYRDRNEDIWMGEGFSDLAMFLNGYDVGGHDRVFALNPDLQLNDWPTDHDEAVPHYGAAFLFMTYFLDRFGEQATRALVANPENGFTSIDTTLQEIAATDPLTGKTIRADDVFTDWTLASYLKDPDIGDGRYTYHNYPSSPQASDTEEITSCNSKLNTRDIRQYGVDYIRIKCNKDTTLHFEASTVVGVVPVDPHSGLYAFWSNKGDESDMTLTRTFDFTGYSGSLTLNYWTWYFIEEDFDYLYLLSSTDGERWDILHTPSGTADDPTGANFGWGYNGKSGTTDYEQGEAQWIQESLDISRFAGKKVTLRFEYVTDTAVNGEGFLLDDISIPEIDYRTDFENDNGGWQATGFVRIQNLLPQTFRLALVSYGKTTSVQYLTFTPDNVADIPLNFSKEIEEAVLVVTATTRFTRQPTAYRYYFTP